MKYKIGDWIVYIDKEWSKRRKELKGISLYEKIAKIIYIDSDSWPYLIEFKENINGHTGNGRGKEGYCLWCTTKQEITLYKDYFKLKKFIEG